MSAVASVAQPLAGGGRPVGDAPIWRGDDERRCFAGDRFTPERVEPVGSVGEVAFGDVVAGSGSRLLRRFGPLRGSRVDERLEFVW